MRFLFVCGGTAGHVNPALAIAGELRRLMPDAEFLFIGSGRQLENRLVPLEGFKIVNISASGFARGVSVKSAAANARAAVRLAVGTAQARRMIRGFKPDAAVGTGGYVCYPVLKAAARMGVPTVIHESNAVPGMTTRMLSGVVDRVLVAFPGMESRCRRPERVTVTGTPVRSGFLSTTRAEAKNRLGMTDRPLVVSFWGSLGAYHMNDMMADFIARAAGDGAFYHIHATGDGQEGLDYMLERLRERGLDTLPEELDLRPYIDDMPAVMAAADLVLCRAGASTLGELTAIGRPAVLVPSPNVTDNHQEKNAAALAAAGGAVMLTESECTGELLYGTVKGLIGDRERLAEMSRKLKEMGAADSAGRIAELILDMC